MSYVFNQENGLPITSWYDDKGDNELYQLCEDYAEKEKEIDKNELETIEQEPQENLIKDINGIDSL